MNLPNRAKKYIDVAGIIIALVVDITINFICFWTLAPDLLTKVAFVCIGIMTVLFVFRSWAKGQKLPWFVFVSVVFFFDYSFALVTTKAQNERISVYEDAEVRDFDAAIEISRSSIVALREERDRSTRPETIATVSSDILKEQAKLDKYEIDRTARMEELRKVGGSEIVITADSVFNAIPDAVNAGRVIPLVVFGFIFFGLQLIVTTSIDPDKKKDSTTSSEQIVETKIVTEYIKPPAFVPTDGDPEEIKNFLDSWEKQAQKDKKVNALKTIETLKRYHQAFDDYVKKITS